MADFPVTLDGSTYDLKRFLMDHPGGTNTLKQYKGKSVLQAMEKFEHSSSAYHMIKEFKISDANIFESVSENGRIITKEEKKRNIQEIQFLEELESRLDYDKALIPQLELIAPHYQTWVNTAVYRSCKLFSNPLLESMSYTPWYLVPMFWIPVILYFGAKQYVEHVWCGDSCHQPAISTPMFVYHLFMGVILWTCLEYCLHRWVFHFDPGSNITLIKMHFLIHGLHHKTPFDGTRQVFPPFPAAVITFILYQALKNFLVHPMIKLVGSLIGYLTYDMIHLYVHRGSPQEGSYLYAMKRYHSNHHFVNHDKAFGISCKLWDYVFRTIVNVKKLGFSLQWSKS